MVGPGDNFVVTHMELDLSVNAGIIRRKPVLTYASIVCDMLASVNSVNSEDSVCSTVLCTPITVNSETRFTS